MLLSMISWNFKTEVWVICRSQKLRQVTQIRGLIMHEILQSNVIKWFVMHFWKTFNHFEFLFESEKVWDHYTDLGLGNWADFELDLIRAISFADSTLASQVHMLLFIDWILSTNHISFIASLMCDNECYMTDVNAFKSLITRLTVFISDWFKHSSIHNHQAMIFSASFTKKSVLLLLWMCLMQESLAGISFGISNFPSFLFNFSIHFASIKNNRGFKFGFIESISFTSENHENTHINIVADSFKLRAWPVTYLHSSFSKSLLNLTPHPHLWIKCM